MIPIEVLKRVTVVYTHANCPDGLASAMILKDAFRMLGMSPRIEFLVHGTPEHLSAGRTGVSLFCDIAPATEERDLSQYNQVMVLDHHKGAEELVRSFGKLGVFADEKLEPGVSGAVLAWREVWKPIETITDRSSIYTGVIDPVAQDKRAAAVKDFALCVGARDTWQTQDPRFQRGQYISAMLMNKPVTYWLAEKQFSVLSSVLGKPVVDRHDPHLDESEIEIGRALFEAHEESVRQAVAECVYSFAEDGGSAATGTGFGDVKTGVELYVFQDRPTGLRLAADVSEFICNSKEPPDGDAMVAGFYYRVDKPGKRPVLVFSLRGLNGFDVGALARANGGGGHTAAASFSIPLDESCLVECCGGNPYKFIRTCLEAYLVTLPK